MKKVLPKALIMLVDDEPENLNVLSGMLGNEEWEVCAFPRGEMALTAAQERTPDLILMDIRMPGMDGYETCRRFKQNPLFQDISVIFLSALSESKNKVEAFKAGGVDYVTKPFYADEVLARVRTHLDLRSHRLHLEELVRCRTEELASAHRRLRIWDGAKVQWLNALSHEMRTPLTGIIGTAEFLFAEASLDPDMQELRQGYELSVRRIKKLIDDALLLTQIDVTSSEFTVEPIACGPLFAAAIRTVQEKFPDIGIELGSFAGLDKVEAEPDLFQRALEDLLLTAECCVLENEKIRTAMESSGGALLIRIMTDGQSLPDESMASFFDVGGQRTLLKGGGDFGLGPALAYRIIQLFNGECSVCNGKNGGILIEIKLPTAQG